MKRRRRRKVFVREVRERNESRVSRSNVSARLQRQIWQCDLRPAANEASLIISSSYLAGDSDALCRARVAPSAGSMSDVTTTTIEGFTRDGHDTLSTTTLCARSLLPRLYYRKYTLSSLFLSRFSSLSLSLFLSSSAATFRYSAARSQSAATTIHSPAQSSSRYRRRISKLSTAPFARLRETAPSIIVAT